MKYSAPAKLNLTLRVHGRREDGFHELETLMVPLPGLEDTLELERADTFSLEVLGAEVGPVEENLVTRALRIFEEHTGRSCSYRIILNKCVPAGAGLGGGSSDAAATLRALDEMEGTGLEGRELESMGAQLGSDVPFFLRKGPCWCRGRGEIVEDAVVDSLEVLLLKPAFGVDTVDAYGRWAGSKKLPQVCYEPQQLGSFQMYNDLERPVFAKFLFLANLKMWLLGQAEVRAALMSGSGATVFAVVHEGAAIEPLAERARKELDPNLWWWGGPTNMASS
ncbi:MAG: 4-(cytidine 5'-diphospho)-2-C-methyl-D-erythritol kinase [Verrucomicrobiaceae bacterium]|nr:4-(cytidine 5'-diphospho)-2-C-methyl-D-erythritol kinase [Verrucomicrobiaceae bacterium]